MLMDRVCQLSYVNVRCQFYVLDISCIAWRLERMETEEEKEEECPISCAVLTWRKVGNLSLKMQSLCLIVGEAKDEL